MSFNEEVMEVILKRHFVADGTRYRKTTPGMTTTIPARLRDQLPKDAVVVDDFYDQADDALVDDEGNADEGSPEGESPSEAAARAFAEELAKEKKTLGDTAGMPSNAPRAAQSAAAKAEDDAKARIENAKKRVARKK